MDIQNENNCTHQSTYTWAKISFHFGEIILQLEALLSTHSKHQIYYSN